MSATATTQRPVEEIVALLNQITVTPEIIRAHVDDKADRFIVGYCQNEKSCLVSQIVLDQVRTMLPEFTGAHVYTDYNRTLISLGKDQHRLLEEQPGSFERFPLGTVYYRIYLSEGVLEIIKGFDKLKQTGGALGGVTAGRVRRQLKALYPKPKQEVTRVDGTAGEVGG